jgi:hypothetical protein
MKVTKIYQGKDGYLSLNGDALATVGEYDFGLYCSDDIFQELNPHDIVELSVDCKIPRLYELDQDLRRVEDDFSWYERTDRRPGDLEDGDWLIHCRNDGTLGSATDRNYHAID